MYYLAGDFKITIMGGDGIKLHKISGDFETVVIF
jgi:hypothetical protein